MPEEIASFLKALISQPGLSAYESPVRELIRKEWQPLVDEISVSRLGSLHAIKRGAGPAPRPSVLLAAHMDAIGLMVVDLVDGFLRVTEVGGIDPRLLPGTAVVVHGRKSLPGLIVQPPAASRPAENDGGPLALEGLLVDTGLPAREVSRQVRVGDTISFAQEPIELENQCLAGHSLDNRASVAALTVCLRELQGRRFDWDVLAVASAQEEETLGGALTSAFELRPTIAIAIDVTFAQSPGLPKHRSFDLGKGPTNDWGPNIHPGIHRALKEAAEAEEIPLTEDLAPNMTGTDVRAMQIAGEGIPTGGVGIPLRYMHSTVETVSLLDVRRAGRLLASLVTRLRPDYQDMLKWD